MSNNVRILKRCQPVDTKVQILGEADRYQVGQLEDGELILMSVFNDDEIDSSVMVFPDEVLGLIRSICESGVCSCPMCHTRFGTVAVGHILACVWCYERIGEE